MNRIHLVLLWHMHQPQYRDPESGAYVLPWTRLHALKDYWGMVKLLEEFPGVHAVFNVVPSLGAQLEEYASGKFDERWFELAFRQAEELTSEDKREALTRAFEVNRERLMSRWPRFVELYEWSRPADGVQALVTFTPRDWRDLQALSQLAWMEESWLEKDPVVSKLASKGKDYTEKDKSELKAKQHELLTMVLPIYRQAAARGQIELTTTPFYHPILPLLCDSDIARVANPSTPLPRRAYRHPEDAREQLRRARAYHERVFGQKPAGLWPSEGSVSDQALAIAAEEGFRWFGSDEGVLGRTLNLGFFRDASGLAANADRLYQPWRIQPMGKEIFGLFRDHHISDLVGFVYSRMDARAAAADLHGRLRFIGERVQTGQAVTVCIFLDGENAWEYFPGNGREFLREFYRRVENDSDLRALTGSEAIAAASQIAAHPGIFPASWINANFDVWIGHSEDVAAWELLWDAREAYSRSVDARAKGMNGAPSEAQLSKAFESLLAAEGSDWCWWFGPEHSTANDSDFDALFRKHLSGVYRALGQTAPAELAAPIKRAPEHALHYSPSEWLSVAVNGRDSSYFEWLGAGLYSPERRGGAMHGRTFYLHELRYGFSEEQFFLRVDPIPEEFATLEVAEFRLNIRAGDEVSLVVSLARGKVEEFRIEKEDVRLLHPEQYMQAAFEKILEVSAHRSLFSLKGQTALQVGVALWHGGLPVDVLPASAFLEIKLGEEHTWPPDANP